MTKETKDHLLSLLGVARNALAILGAMFFFSVAIYASFDSVVKIFGVFGVCLMFAVAVDLFTSKDEQ